MVDVRILNRTEYMDLSKGAPGTPSVMVLFQLPDLRQGVARIRKGEERTPAERAAIQAEIARMGKPPGEYISV
jgi:hypothetical protein